MNDNDISRFMNAINDIDDEDICDASPPEWAETPVSRLIDAINDIDDEDICDAAPPEWAETSASRLLDAINDIDDEDICGAASPEWSETSASRLLDAINDIDDEDICGAAPPEWAEPSASRLLDAINDIDDEDICGAAPPEWAETSASRLLDAINDIDDEDICGAAPPELTETPVSRSSDAMIDTIDDVIKRKSKINIITRYVSLAACTVLVVGIGLFAIMYKNNITSPVTEPIPTYTDHIGVTESSISESKTIPSVSSNTIITDNTTNTTSIHGASGNLETMVGGSVYTECKNIEEAEKIVGFNISVSPLSVEYDKIKVYVINNVIIDVIYYDINDNEVLCIQKGNVDYDISERYPKFDVIEEVRLGDRNVTLKGTLELIHLAIWTENKYSYSVFWNTGIDRNNAEMIILQIS